MPGPVYKLPNGTLYPSTQFLLETLVKAGADRQICGELATRFTRQAVENMELKSAARHAGIILATRSPPKEG